MPLETMLRVHFFQNWYTPGDPMAEESLLDSEATRRFADIGPSNNRVPDETTIPDFRHLLEKQEPIEKLFAEVNPHLVDKGATLRGGTLVAPR